MVRSFRKDWNIAAKQNADELGKAGSWAHQNMNLAPEFGTAATAYSQETQHTVYHPVTISLTLFRPYHERGNCCEQKVH